MPNNNFIDKIKLDYIETTGASVLNNMNIKTLIRNMLSSDIPQDISIVNKIDVEKLLKIIQDIKNKEYTELYEIDPDTGLITILNLSPSHVPPNIFNVGSESIDYLSFKKDTKYRKKSIPNFIFYIAFIYNTIEVFEDLYKELYLKIESKYQDLISYSNSPIINEQGDIIINQYDELESEDLKVPYGGILDKESLNSLFEQNMKKNLAKEGTKTFILQTDIENFYSSIYTHSIAGLGEKKPFGDLKPESKTIKKYFEFLDYYNMKTNNNETIGILTGPISSMITAELLMISFDGLIIDKLKELEITYTRYIDDMNFYSNSKANLEELLSFIQRVLHNYRLEINNYKTRIESSISKYNITNKEKLYIDFPYLKEDENTIHDFTINKLLYFQKYVKKLMEEEKTGKYHLLLSLFKSKFSDNRITIESDVLSYFINFIIKVIFLNPITTEYGMKLIEVIIKENKSNKNAILNIFYENRKIVHERYPNTTIQIWFYYFLNQYVCYIDRKELWAELETWNAVENEEINPLVVLTFITGDKEVNILIRDYVEKIYNNVETNNYKENISYSKWWIVIFELYNEDRTIFNDLFTTKRGFPNKKRMGILKSLF